ncbi:MAG: hypothetical protein HOV79_19615 [Hamadaea sp.]|nr:hypothetical protein [Hamadaea sp.]
MARPQGGRNKRRRSSREPLPLWGKVLAAAGALGLLTWGALANPLGQKIADRIFPQETGAAPAPVAFTKTWPLARNCDAATTVAVLRNGPKPDQVRSPVDRNELVGSGSAVFGNGWLYITISVTDDRVISVTDVRPVIFRKGPAEASWIYEPQGGCGDQYSRLFELDLDGPLLKDLGVQGPEELAPPGVRVPAQPVGQAFTVSKSDPAEIVVTARGCRAYYEWGIQISYVADGHQLTYDIGSAANPFRSIGVLGQKAPVYADSSQEATDRTKLAPYGTRAVPLGCSP